MAVGGSIPDFDSWTMGICRRFMMFHVPLPGDPYIGIGELSMCGTVDPLPRTYSSWIMKGHCQPVLGAPTGENVVDHFPHFVGDFPTTYENNHESGQLFHFVNFVVSESA